MRIRCLFTTLLVAFSTASAAMAADLSVANIAAGVRVLTSNAVPRTNKAAGELVGTVNHVSNLGSVCGVQAAIVWVSIPRGPALLTPIGAICAGNTLAACRALAPGRRVQLLGTLAAVPDSTTDGFDPCDPDTWEFVTPAFAFAVTRINR